MNGLLDILLAAKDDGRNWINMLIPIIIVIVYAVSGIVKMRSNVDKEQPTKEQQKPRYKPLDDQGRGWERPAAEPAAPEMSPAQRRQVDGQIERKLAPQPAPARQPVPARQQQRRTLEAFLQTVAPKPPTAAPQPAAAQARQQRLRAQTAQRQQTARKIKPKAPPQKAKVAARKETPAEPSSITSLAERLAQPDEIRRAIIYAEILGKPIALRDM